jgi:hypothetical protein
MKVQKGVLRQPFKLLIYGPEGVAKTTLASGAPKAIFFDPNGRTGQVDCERRRGSNWSELQLFLVEAAKSDYETIVLDEMGTIEAFCWTHICERDKQENIESYGYKEGYAVALQEMRTLLATLERTGKNIILIGHSQVRPFKNPEGDDYSRFEVDLYSGKANVAGLVKRWADAVLFFRFETYASENKKKIIGAETGSRIIHTQHKAAFDAKNSYDMPEEIEVLDGMGAQAWDLLARYVTPESSDNLIKMIRVQLKDLDEEKKKTAAKYIDAAGNDARKLTKTLNWLEKQS